MEEIKDLIKIVSKHTKKNIPLLDLKTQIPNGNKEMNLFLGIKSGDFNSDSDASNGIYGTEDVDFKFRMLKSRLNRKLLNHLFFMDFPTSKFPKSVNLYQEALDYLHFSRMLLKIGEIKLGTKLLGKTVDLAKECEFTTIVIDSLKELRDVYSITYRPKLFKNIKEEIEKYQKLQNIEDKASSLFYENKLMLNSTVNNRKKSYDPVKKAISSLNKLAEETSSFNIYFQALQLKIWYLELIGEFESVLKLVDEINKELENESINTLRFDSQILNIAKSNALIKLNRFKEGSDFLGEILNETDESSDTWFTYAEKYFVLNVQMKNYDLATDIFIKAINNKAFDSLSEEGKLKWNIFRGYLFYLTGNNKIIKKFDLRNFIETTPLFEKDKAGFNTAIIILQVLSKVTGDLSSLHNSLESLDEYVNKYLNNSFSKRTKTFCKLLHKIATHNRDYDTIIIKSKYLEEKLFGSEKGGKSFVDFEVSPYEHLWEIALRDVRSFRESFL